MTTAQMAMLAMLVKSPPVYRRGNWHHYRCFACGDHSAHLGINVENGRVKCMRCGFSGQVDTTSAKPRSAPEPRPDFFFGDFAEYQPDAGDDVARGYMRGRGVPSSAEWAGWWFRGRGEAQDCPVFVARDRGGQIVYCQWRNTKDDAKLRYLSPRGLKPRLDFTERGRQSLLVLTEGPIDCLRVRAATGAWCSPNWGADFKAGLMGELSEAAKAVVLFFDNDEPGRKASNKLRVLLHCGGFHVMEVDYESAGVKMVKDPGELGDDAIRVMVNEAEVRL